ncbi:MAG: hypothetical protein IJU93_03960 [Lachnospiraceae bacterium]|nr:hypothetical protein [Lachnospiraceae bacterium]
MGKVRRISNILLGIVMIVAGIILGLRRNGYYLAIVILGLLLVFRGFMKLIYYLVMARYMVGGKRILFTAIFMLDLGGFSLTLADIPRIFVLLYLLVIYASAGVIHILRSIEAKKQQSPTWRGTLVLGLGNIIIATLCVSFRRDDVLVGWLFAAGIIYSGLIRIINSLRSTAIVYIQ